MATAIDDNAADENLYKLFGEMSLIQYTGRNARFKEMTRVHCREREEKEMNLFDSKKKLGIAGVVMGLVAATLAYFGNPANMAICIACFVRDTAGALGLHSAEPVQYARPEIIGIVLGAFIISIATKEYRARAGSSTIVRFVLGMILVIGALVFLGCPLRMVIRM